MTTFKLPKWVIKTIDRIRRDFLWGKFGITKRGVSLLNWDSVCIQKSYGGLGVSNLEYQNWALLLRWWWQACTNQAMWTEVVKLLHWKGYYESGPKLWTAKGSFFWRQPLKLMPMFQWSTMWEVGEGTTVSFWNDSWHGTPLRALQEGSRPPRPSISVRDALPIMQTLIPNQNLNVSIQLTQQRDRILWHWAGNGLYSAKSFYRVIMAAGKIKWQFNKIWKSTTPLTVRIFAFLLLRNKLLTREVLQRRGIQCELGCMMCNNCPTETALHLFFLCPNAVSVWCALFSTLGLRVMSTQESVHRVWECSWQQVRGTMTWVQWSSMFLSTCWMIWKQRNDKFFNGRETQPSILADRAVHEATKWMHCCK